MQESTNSNQTNQTTLPHGDQPNLNDQDESSLQCSRYERRNAITPEAHHIEPIRQTEVVAKMSDLTMSSDTSETLGHSSTS